MTWSLSVSFTQFLSLSWFFKFTAPDLVSYEMFHIPTQSQTLSQSLIFTLSVSHTVTDFWLSLLAVFLEQFLYLSHRHNYVVSHTLVSLIIISSQIFSYIQSPDLLEQTVNQFASCLSVSHTNTIKVSHSLQVLAIFLFLTYTIFTIVSHEKFS